MPRPTKPTPKQGEKFPNTINRLKFLLAETRRQRGVTVGDGAVKMGFSRKVLEDLEATRNYGRNPTAEDLAIFCKVYDCRLTVNEHGEFSVKKL